MKKACILIPYYGTWPKYLDIYLSSCANNNWLDIYFFTDIKVIPYHPANVKFINFPLSELEERVAKLLNLTEYSLPNSYKLCDLRPLYGEIFSEEISKYEYWGFGDCDLVYGNLKHFISDELNKGIDVISFNEQRNSGSLMLIKNLNILNQLYLKLENYKNLVQQVEFRGMDEVCHQWNETDKLKLSKSCLTYWFAKLTASKSITSSYKNRIIEEIKFQDLINVNNGKVYRNCSEIAYFHYVCNKSKPQFSYPNWDKVPIIFYINETGFYKNKKTAILLRLVKKYPKLFIYYMRKFPSYFRRRLTNRV